MTIYLDSEYKCYVADLDNSLQAVETDFFDGKCQAYIEGYRFVPDGATWTREDGTIFTGLMVSPWKNYNELANKQAAYEREELQRLRITNAEYEAALAEIEAALM